MMIANPVTQFGRFTLMVMAGGTGGHVYPAIAVADYLKAHDWQIVWLTTEGGMENKLIAGKGYKTATITMQGVRGKGLMGWLKLPTKLFKAFSQSHAAIKQYQPDVVLGMGGFAAFPGGMKAWMLNKPLVIHEQNSVAGLTNKVLKQIANSTLSAFPSAFGGGAVLVGNPVRADLTVLESPKSRYAQHSGPLRLLVIGGSLGAAALNEVLPKALASMPSDARPVVIHQAGEKQIAALQANYLAAGVTAETKAYINNMAAVYAWADLVICRAGAMTIAELACVGVASILVPFPHAVDDHQTTNAQYLSDQQAAILVQQTEFTVSKAAELITSFSREKCVAMAENAKKLAKPNATEEVAKVCMAYAYGKTA